MAEISVMNHVASPRKPGLLSRCLSAANKSTAKALLKYIAAPLALWLAAQGVAQATDLAAAGKGDVEATFGEDSTMMYYFMIAEVFLVFMLYLRNHNPATFVLIPVFIVVTKVIFSIVGGTAGTP
ncbi:conjugal transfer protein TraA [Salmonella enterica]|uniref:Pilin n=2 Tax=Salmonella enterica I TaxID=59201 RepID=A0A719CW92_SALTS|nr:type IV conjugative transfer system pilin TraA [Salmonella enterica]EBG3527962.1 conjugal transfer protein TraA [Salmonella enterica subsp. enterica]EBR9087172.1 conjugal transfer protein TraA [Salmonella enterica subsp. enterica serovar Oranienburg]EBS1478521.1 conjugal transfer protein TraA [Salmonella enterica subsp. enterica serovar Saintpaul]EBU7006304.1 conjugal transfer protein TraA [Salmonella enterica subsp. enterica serovar Kintambo]EBV4595319.1 conjugal transfer protein TraA [Sal